MDLRLALMTGINIPIPECKIVIRQPTILEISYIGDEDFFIGVQTLCVKKSMFVEDKSVINDITNFQIFMTVMNNKETIDKKQNTIKVLNLLLPNYKILITPRAISLIDENNNSYIIDENNFDIFQSILELIFCTRDGSMDQQAFNPADDKAREIAEKIMAGRRKVAEIKGKNTTSIFSQYLSILSVGLKIPVTEFLNYTIYQLYDLIERYHLYISWDMDARIRLAGGKPDSEPENWMKDIHN